MRGLEGSSHTVCVYATPQGLESGALDAKPRYGNPTLVNGALSAPRHCIHIKIRRCQHCVNPTDSLLSLMKGLSPDLNWLRLWAANGNDANDIRTSTITDPVMLAVDQRQQVFNVGPIYTITQGDTLMSVAARFRTTIKSLLLLNPDVGFSTVLPLDQQLCLIPCAA